MSEPTPRHLHVHSVPSPAERLRTVVEIVAILVAGVWALYTFVYEQRIKPLSEAASFAVPTEISQTAVVNGVAFVRIRKILENTGNVPIDLAAESLSVYGETAGKALPQSAVGKRDPYSAEIRADVPRTVRKVLYSFAKLREGAINGKPNVNFVVPPHSSNSEEYLVAVPVRQFPLIHIMRKDYIRKSPVVPRVDVRIIRTSLGAFDLASKDLLGEYDSDTEYAIRP
ncbi:MAG: hypothetical protein JO193_02320 [Candidatus Eremiobacteraeota bacterium]|nr:hypothetical protein [Candidatus Eremiobacteraeota bacterium]